MGDALLSRILDAIENLSEPHSPLRINQICQLAVIEAGMVAATLDDATSSRLAKPLAHLWFDEHALSPAADSGLLALRLTPDSVRAAVRRHGTMHVDRVEVSRLSRFGNAIIQLVNAMDLANAVGAREVSVVGAWFLPMGDTDIAGVTVINHATPEARAQASQAAVTLAGVMFNRNDLLPAVAHHVSGSVVSALGPALTVPRLDPLPPDHLVIHVRAGDIFASANPAPTYGQPPLAFYQRLLQHAPWSAVTVVYEDTGNPVVEPLLTQCRALGLTTHSVSGDLADDLAVVLSARTLACGWGTFGFVVAGLSEHCSTFVSFDSVQVPLGGRPMSILVATDLRGGYREAVLSGNWANTPQQRDLMLNYRVDDVSEVGFAPRD